MRFTANNFKDGYSNHLTELHLLKNASSQIVYLVPTKRAANALRLRLVRNNYGMSEGFPHIFTIQSLAVTLLSNIKPVTTVSDAGALSILKGIIKTGQYTHFGSVSGEIPFGTLRQLRAMFLALKRNGITPDELLLMVSANKENEQLQEYADIYREYYSKFIETGLYEPSDVIEGFNLLKSTDIENHCKKILPKVSLVKCIWFSDISRPEGLFIYSIAKACGANAWIDFDLDSTNDYLFGHLSQMTENLFNIGFVSEEETEPEQNVFASHLKRFLFTVAPKKIVPPQVSLSEFKIEGGKQDEIETIAIHIRNLMEQGVQPGTIAVGFKLINEYSPIIRRIFDEYAVPYNLTDRFSLSDNIVSGRIFAILKLAESDYHINDLLVAYGYFSGIFLKESAGAIRKFAKKLNIHQGVARWEEKLHAEISEATNLKHFADRALAESISSDIRKLKSLTDRLRGKITISGYEEVIREILRQCGYPLAVFSEFHDHTILNSRALKVFISTLQEFVNIERTEHGQDTPRKVSELNSLFRTANSEARYNYPKGFKAGVQITTYEELRGLQFDHVIFAGMYEENFPAKYSREIVKIEQGNASANRYLKEQRYLFYQTLLTARKHLYFSYPSAEAKKKYNESNFLYHLKRCCVIGEIEVNMKLYSEKKFKIRLGEVLGVACQNEENLEEYTTLERKITVEKNRSEHNEYSGVLTVSKENVAKQIENKLSKPVSFTELETYVNCSFQYFCHYMLNVCKSELPKEELDNADKGKLLHTIMERFIKEAISTGKNYSEILEKDTMKERLFEITKEEIRKYDGLPPLSVFELENILGDYNSLDKGLIGNIYSIEKIFNAEKNNQPVSTEEPFHSNSAKIGGFILKAKIDRIDKIDLANQPSYIIIDYKSGKINELKKAWVMEKKVLQLPLYALALERANENINNPYRVTELYYNRLVTGNDAGYQKFSPKNPDKFLSDLLEDIPELTHVNNSYPQLLYDISEFMLESLYKEIEQGNFRLTDERGRRDGGHCSYCTFASICRKHQLDE